MITLSKSGSTVTFTFDENSGYLQNGTIDVPVNSLSLVIDDSDMATFRKSASNDIFISARYEEFGMSKAELEAWYKANMVSSGGGGGTGGTTPEEVQQMIDSSISGKTDTSAFTAFSGDVQSTLDEIETVAGAAFNDLNDRMAEKLDASAYTPVDLSDYYTTAQTDSAIDAATSGKVDISTFETYSGSVETALSGKQDTLSAGTNITINGNVISASGGEVSTAITSGDTNPVEGGVLYDELRIPATGDVETVLEWNNYDGGETTNYPSGATSSVVFEVYSESNESNGYEFRDSNDESLGDIVISYNNGVTSVANYNNVTYSISGNVVTVNYPSIAANVTYIASSYDNNWTVKAIVEGEIIVPLIDKVSANTASISALDTRLGGLTLIKLTQSAYDALSPNYDSNTLYVVTDS